MADRWTAATTEAHGWLKCKALKGYMIDLSFLGPQRGALECRAQGFALVSLCGSSDQRSQ